VRNGARPTGSDDRGSPKLKDESLERGESFRKSSQATQGRLLAEVQRCERLPNRRPAFGFAVECQRPVYTATVGRFRDGRLAEILLTNHKNGLHADAGARDGVRLRVIIEASLRDGNGRPLTPLGAALDALEGELAR
jgi:hypothetical protein